MKWVAAIMGLLVLCLVATAFVMAGAANFNQSQASIEQSHTTQQAQQGWLDADRRATIATVLLVAALVFAGFLGWKNQRLQIQVKLLTAGQDPQIGQGQVDVAGYLREGRNGPTQVRGYTRAAPAGQLIQPDIQNLIQLKILELLQGNSHQTMIQPQEQPADEWWRQP